MPLLVAAVLASAAAVGAAPSRPVHVACVGDSITAGYLAHPGNMSYPSQMQALLDARFGEATYDVKNFGAGGATVQRGAVQSPYWNRSQFASFVNGSYDVVIIMLGTNDAHTEPTSPRWPLACNLPSPSAEQCSVVKDYLALIDVARTKGIGGRAPLITLMTPPPLWRDADYGMNQTVINDVLPGLTRHIAKLASLAAPIDIFSTLGGTSNWRAEYPPCGCRLSTSGKGGEVAGAAAGAGTNFTQARGFLLDGNDIAVGNYTWVAAAKACSRDSTCAGFSFDNVHDVNNSKPTTPIKMYLKRCSAVEGSNTWWSWTKPPDALPKPPMPKSCALFCDETSCDACHPDNVGYGVLAKKVFDYLVAHRPSATE